ncbi:helix-turn-helix domain-containing protein [Streptomyces sp. NPDC001002]
MIGTVFRSTDVPVEHRFDYWRELMARTLAPSVVTSDHAAEYWAEQRVLRLGPMIVWPSSFLPTRYRRDTKLIRRSDPEQYQLSLVLGGGLSLDHAGRNSFYGPGDMWVSDSSLPYDLRSRYTGDRQAVSGVSVRFPKALLPVSPDRVRELVGRRMSAREGTSALVADFLTGLNRQSAVLDPSDAPRLGTILLDLLSVWFARPLEAEAALSPETRGRALTVRVQAFIRQNLHDPGLTPPVIAAAHHISVSYLHRLFGQQTQGETVARWIRDRRMEGARRDLADPALRDTPIHTIAARWGVPRASDFTRAFRAAYGTSPKEFRFQALSGSRRVAKSQATHR